MELKTTVKRIIGCILLYVFIFGLCYITAPKDPLIVTFVESLFLIVAVALIVGFCFLLIWLFTSK